MKKSDRHQLSAVIHHFLYRTYELPLSWYGMTVPGLSQADITCLHGTCRTVLFAADRLMIAGDLPVLDARPFNDRVVHSCEASLLALENTDVPSESIQICSRQSAA